MTVGPASATPPEPTPLEAAAGAAASRGVLALFGSAFVAAVACVDPDNIAGGAQSGYPLVSVFVAAT
jgi:Mn2+/Fe2+ NRAMP family transporter